MDIFFQQLSSLRFVLGEGRGGGDVYISLSTYFFKQHIITNHQKGIYESYRICKLTQIIFFSGKMDNYNYFFYIFNTFREA